MGTPDFHVAAPPQADPDEFANQLRVRVGASVTTNPELDPSHVDSSDLDAIVVAGGEMDAPDVLAAADSVPAAALTDGTLHPGMRECGLGRASVLLTDTKRPSATEAMAHLLLEADPPFRTTIIRPDGDAEWRSDYGDTAVSVPDGNVLVPADPAPDWATRVGVQAVVADGSGTVIGAGRVGSPKTYPDAYNVEASITYSIL